MQEIIARLDVRWIECACASICWTTQIIYHLEAPYGHLMQNEMRGPHARTAVRGSITSFPMPAEAIMKNLQNAIDNSALVPMPHDGKVLSILVPSGRRQVGVVSHVFLFFATLGTDIHTNSMLKAAESSI